MLILYFYEYVRCVGLATDSSALGLTLFLLSSIAFIGVYCDANKLFRIICVILLTLILRDVVGTMSRMSSMGVVLIFFIVFVVYAIAMNHWSPGRRAVVGFVPIVGAFIVLALLWQSPAALQLTGTSGLADRLSQNWSDFNQGGQIQVIGNEVRLKYAVTAYQLISESPLVGWGPGGFYRESNSMRYREGHTADLFDSPANHYLMIAVDFGLPVLLLNIAIAVFPILIGIFSLRKLEDSMARFQILLLLCSNIIFAVMITTVPPSYFMGVMWIWTAQIAMLVVIAERNEGIICRFKLSVYKKHILVATILISFLSLGVNYQVAFGEKYGYASRADHPWWLVNKSDE